MKFQLSYSVPGLVPSIDHRHHLILTGSCFSENIAQRLAERKFSVLQNPNGILYDPRSITSAIISYIEKKTFNIEELYQQTDLWHSWQHHGSFSGTDPDQVISAINNAQTKAHEFLRNADWLMITLGSAYAYSLVSTGDPVANCHKAPAGLFRKELLTIEQIKSALDTCIHRVFHFNPRVRILFTVSPVRYIRDGLVENNLSKARLIEVVQQLVSKFDRIHYFPSYELVNDVLRDYRFFKEDMVHPSEQAIDYVFGEFAKACFNADTTSLVAEIQQLNSALMHKPHFPASEAHQRFREKLIATMIRLEHRYDHLDFSKEKEVLDLR